MQSGLERRFLRLVRKARLPEPVTQRIYRPDGVHIARVDFAFSPVPVVVEVGGRRGYVAADDRRRLEHRPYELATVSQALEMAA